MNVDRKSNPLFSLRSFFLLFVYLTVVAILTLKPFNFSYLYFRKAVGFGLSSIYVLNSEYYYVDIINNILLFIPFGIILHSIIRKRAHKSSFRPLLFVFMISFFVSGLIESAQLFLDRWSSIWDVGSNVVGSCFGYFIAEKLDLVSIAERIFESRKRLILSRAVTILYCCVIFTIFLIPPYLNTFDNWSEDFHLLIGNEETMDRPWSGKIFLVSIYSTSLKSNQIRDLFSMGPDNKEVERRRSLGSIALYTFNADSGNLILDRSGYRHSLDLEGREIELFDGGIKISGGNGLRSLASGKKIVARLKDISRFSVEVWLQVDDLIQGGPARIVSLSGGREIRNFTLAQQGSALHLRVRTPLTGRNGSRINLKAEGAISDFDVHHLVATFNRGVEMLFVDGKLHPDFISGHLDYLPEISGLGSGFIGKTAFLFILFFPLGFILYWSSRRRNFITIFIATLLLISLFEGYIFVRFGCRVLVLYDFMILLFSLIGGVVGAILNYCFLKEDMTNEK